MKFLKRILSLIIILVPMQTVWAATADELTQLLNNLKSSKADFTQTIMNGRGQILQQTSGTMTLQRPGRFRWEVRVPNRQLLIADGQRIWFYDVDLQQVTIQKQQTASANSPAALLSEAPKNLAAHFIISPLIDAQGFHLVPKDKKAIFQSISLIFQQNKLREMRLIDKLGQQTVVNFSQVELNPYLASQTFHFIIPTNKNIELVKG
ncbi:MAG: outer membrane lipoprotein carrier protein LolA [Candidatus Aquirickettsiella gammari]|uniref:Outer-membrane lipoprotein carrier protein n=1 Tax=Candidatus Aquirickettsiella gammari TaxID=2016198 RepID=A0A370CHQ3_9COXI|nr:MAG: outer membrane lipoprotein carrier protein LolA [Candidatus Aquirickettsiella gammari]